MSYRAAPKDLLHGNRSTKRRSKCQWIRLRLVSTLAAAIKAHAPRSRSRSKFLLLFPSDVLPATGLFTCRLSQGHVLCVDSINLIVRYTQFSSTIFFVNSPPRLSSSGILHNFRRLLSLPLRAEDCHLRQLFLSHAWWLYQVGTPLETIPVATVRRPAPDVGNSAWFDSTEPCGSTSWGVGFFTTL